jgi:hypothetical protein
MRRLCGEKNKYCVKTIRSFVPQRDSLAFVHGYAKWRWWEYKPNHIRIGQCTWLIDFIVIFTYEHFYLGNTERPYK